MKEFQLLLYWSLFTLIYMENPVAIKLSIKYLSSGRVSYLSSDPVYLVVDDSG